jgi:hypothetical protein
MRKRKKKKREKKEEAKTRHSSISENSVIPLFLANSITRSQTVAYGHRKSLQYLI